MFTRILRAALLLGTLTAASYSADKFTENTVKLSAGEKSPPATLADLQWLAGHWVGEAFGGQTEEIWMNPAGPNMAGLFRLHKDGKTIFYEIMAVTELDGSLVFRLKHFNSDLTGWEEKNEVQAFPLVARRGTAMLFEGMSFHPAGDSLVVNLAVEHKDKPTEEVKFTYRRHKESRP